MRTARYFFITLGGSSLLAMDDMKENIAFYTSIRVGREGVPS
jgi:hypothetical protein